MTTPASPPTAWKPLAGYRVLDLADEQGQLAARFLADLGADVIKVEMPRRGDRTRAFGPFYKDQPGAESSLYWWAMNAGKRSVTCALQVEAGRALFHRLVAVSDVVIETNQPGTHTALGIDYPTLSATNPGVIVVSVTSWKDSGARSGERYRVNDLVASAAAGLMYFDAGDDAVPPWRTTMPQVYVQANIRAAVSAVAALVARGSPGAPGQRIEVALEDVASAIGARQSARQEVATRRIFDAADGRVAVPPLGGLPGPAGASLLDWMVENGSGGDLGTPHWRTRLASSAALDAADSAAVEGVLARFCAERPVGWLVEEAQKRGGAWTPVNTIRAVLENRHLATRGAWTAVAHEDDGESFTYPAMPWRVEGAATGGTVRAPHVGEHNEQVYGDLLKIDESDLRRLRMRMVV